MDFAPIITALIGALSGGIGTYLTFRQQTKSDAAKTRIDLLRIVDERTNNFIKRLEEELVEKDEQITRLEKVATDLRRLVYRLINELRRHDPDAADQIAGEMP